MFRRADICLLWAHRGGPIVKNREIERVLPMPAMPERRAEATGPALPYERLREATIYAATLAAAMGPRRRQTRAAVVAELPHGSRARAWLGCACDECLATRPTLKGGSFSSQLRETFLECSDSNPGVPHVTNRR
jgi:hypothetical protein